MSAARTSFPVASPTVECGRPGVIRRRRGAVLEDAILDAVFAELAEVGYAAFTIESVAARAQTGKASIYRRWTTKQDLVLDAFCYRFGQPDDAVEAMRDQDITTRDLLVMLAVRMSEHAEAAAEVVRAVACELARDADLAAAVEDRVFCPKRAALVQLLERGVARGEVRPDAACDFYADVLPGVVMHRMILMNQVASEADVIEIIDRVVMPLIAPV